ncbi:hypothetical protein [Pseudanabaena sp. PCC 6802]|uniref:hypothetical protein n=1 Tax=Pseudanabaena sp. PCC 6802 TaxID=118173 RepID=UPI000345AA4D|nr:hypothetical protein [Pseudanabaena sp. PCC 6802]
MNEMSLEKQFAHTKFCHQIQDIDLEAAKKLLADLHLLYLGQQALFAEMAKRGTI